MTKKSGAKTPPLGAERTDRLLEFSDLTPERPMDIGQLTTPKVVSGPDDEWIVYDRSLTADRPEPKKLVTKFADLAAADDRAIFEFAKLWGPLVIGEDGWKRREDFEGTLEEAILEGEYDREAARKRRLRYLALSKAEGRAMGNIGRESFEGWRKLARRFRSAILIGAALSNGQGGTEELWSDLGVFALYAKAILSDKTLYGARLELQKFVNAMVVHARVAPTFWWNGKRWQLGFQARGISHLMGVLVIQLMLLIANTKGLAVCSGCNGPFTPHRMPDTKGERRIYCPKCRSAGKPLRDAQRDRRARQAKLKKLDA